jgi:hypothetical protein
MSTPFAANAVSEQFEVEVPGSIVISVLAVLNQPSLRRRMSDAGWEQSRLHSALWYSISPIPPMSAARQKTYLAPSATRWHLDATRRSACTSTTSADR